MKQGRREFREGKCRQPQQPAEFRVSSGFELRSRPKARSEAAPQPPTEKKSASVLSPGGGTALHPPQGRTEKGQTGKWTKLPQG